MIEKLDNKRKLAVFSHHRSGTHFLMNSIAMNSNYIYRPYWQLDFNLGVDIWATPKLSSYFKKYDNRSVNNIMKSHYFVDFFENILEDFTNNFHVFYIMREPCDTLASYYRYSRLRDWLEAPNVKNISEFIKAEPVGSCLRWQRKQYRTMLQRWEAHVTGWHTASKSYCIHIIRYEDLLYDFENTMLNILNIIGVKSNNMKKPELTGIDPWCGGRHKEMYNMEDVNYIRTNVNEEIWNIWN